MGDASAGPRTAVIVMAYGSPERPEDIPAYFADIRGGRPVPPERVEELAERYRRIGRTSPLNEITERQRAGLEAELGLPVYTGMKHWRPWIADVAVAARDGGAERLVALVLAPHYSRMSIGGYREQLEASLKATRAALRRDWHGHEPFVALVADQVAEPARPHGAGHDAHVVFTAHSLPQRILSEGGPYASAATRDGPARRVRASLAGGRWSFAFQSESKTGEPWLGPDILEHLSPSTRRASAVCSSRRSASRRPPRILWDLDVEARQRAGGLGVELWIVR